MALSLKHRFFGGSTIQYDATDVRGVTVLAHLDFQGNKVRLSTKRSDEALPVFSHYSAEQLNELFHRMPRGSRLVALT